MKKYRRLPVALVAACLTVGMVAAPSAVAAPSKAAKAKAGAKAKAAGSRITVRSVNSRVTRTNRTLTSTRRSLTSTRRSLSKVTKDMGALSNRLKSAEGGLGTLLGAAPQLVNGLQTLGNAVTTQIVPGLQTIQGVLTNQVQPALIRLRDEVGPGLVKAGESITALAAAQEFGIVQTYLDDTAVEGQILTSSDIPDDGNAAILTGTQIVQIPPNAANVPIKLRAAVRSGESDGLGASDPVASAGIASMTVEGATPGVTVGGGVAGLTPDVGITTVPAGAGQPPVRGIAEKAPRVDTPPNPFAFPTDADQSIELTDPATLFNAGGGVSRLNVSAGAGGGVALVKYTVRFHDLSGSTTDLTE